MIKGYKKPRYLLAWFLSALIPVISSCSQPADKRFTLLPADSTNIHFENTVKDSTDFNILNYLYFYDGGGVAAGDINNDGLVDLFFTANQKPDQLYLNEGNFIFRDITREAGIYREDNGWSTGVTMADLNGDGYLDIYVSRVNYLSKSGANQLFINNGKGRFTEEAARYGLDLKGYGTQAAFFDYDLDGDLDLFQLNHTMHTEKSYGEAAQLRSMRDPKAGDRLFRNDGGKFVEVTAEAGIFSSHLGYGLGIAISDINWDGWPDVYIGNDFHEDDYLYINQKDGTFKEELARHISHTSRSTMGVDIADINNDALPEVFTLDMLPADDQILKRSGGADLKIVSETKANFGFKPQFAHNALQLHRGFREDGSPLFSEIGFAAGVGTTDWSWSALIMDLDNNGYNDLFAANGIYRRPNDLDFVRKYQNFQKEQISGEVTPEQLQLIEAMPHVKLPNYLFKNSGNLPLKNISSQWGLDKPSYSNGAVYADFNNDGTLDLAVNNINMPAFVYRNNTVISDSSRFLKIRLKGQSPNTSGIGTKVLAYRGDKQFYREQQPVRGFQSSVSHILHMGLGTTATLDSMKIIWPDRRIQTLYNVESNQIITVNQKAASGEYAYTRFHMDSLRPYLQNITAGFHPHSSGKPSQKVDDIKKHPLQPFSKTTVGPALAVGDVNGDGKGDLFLGGLKWESGDIYLQQQDGMLQKQNQTVFTVSREAADVDATFFDADGDADLDLYVVSGGNVLTGIDPALEDRLYLNDGKGNFRRSGNNLPPMFINGGTVAAADYDGDGDKDLFVGGQLRPLNYGISPRSYLLENDGTGFFTDVTSEIAPELERPGMINDAAWADLDPENPYPELILAGEWMPLTIFGFDGTKWINKTAEFSLQNTGGLWQSLVVEDFNNDGRTDFAAGNFGLNSRLKVPPDTSVRLYVNNFMNSGRSVPVVAIQNEGRWYPFETLDELATQLPALSQQFDSYKDFSTTPLNDIFITRSLKTAVQKELAMLQSAVFINNDSRSFHQIKLPFLAQITPVLAIESGQFTNDRYSDLLVGGNILNVKPSYGGSQDAGKGLLLQGNGDGTFRPVPFTKSGFWAEGEIRAIKKEKNSSYIYLSRYGNTPLIFKINSNTSK